MPADRNSAWMAFQSVSLMSTEYVCSVGAKRSEQLIPPAPPAPAPAPPAMPPAPVGSPPAPPAEDVSTAASAPPPPVPVIPDGPELPQPRLVCTANVHTRNATPL